VASGRVSTSKRTLTNWFGKSALSVFANSAFSLTVPVVGVDLVIDGEQLARLPA
jgi:hypothetical protein